MVTTTTATKPFTLRPHHERLLRGSETVPVGLYQLHLATAEQLCRLHHSPGSLKAVKARLKELVDAGYLQADCVPTKRFKSPYYYGLSAQGLKYLERTGLDIGEIGRLTRDLSRSWLFLQHTLELNDVLIATALLHKADPRFHLDSFIHDRVLKRTLPSKLIPDAFLDVRAQIDGKQRRMPVLLEHDRGTEEQQHFRGKIRSYISLLRAREYERLFNTHAISVLFTTFVSPARLLQMRQWAYQELSSTQEPHQLGQVLQFGLLPKPPDPKTVWFTPIWYTPYGTTATALLT